MQFDEDASGDLSKHKLFYFHVRNILGSLKKNSFFSLQVMKKS